jgi:hypothetical protein
VISLPPYQDLVTNTTYLIEFLAQNGIQDIESIEMKNAMAGGTAGNNRRAEITFKNQTSLQAVVKGSRNDNPIMPTGVREALFYSRLAPTMPSSVPTPDVLFAAVDPDTNQQFIVMAMMEGVVSLRSIFPHFTNSSALQEVIGSTEFDFLDCCEKMIDLHADFAASHWLDKALMNETWLKGVSWINGKDRHQFEFSRGVVIG